MEELDVWNENLVIQAHMLMLEASKIKWKLEWLNSELKSTKNQFQDELTRVQESILEYGDARKQN